MSLTKSTESITGDDLNKSWHLVDLDGATLGRAATRIATILRGKHTPAYTPHNDCGDFVVVVNSAKAVLTGKKLDQKMYRHHTQFPGGLKEATARSVFATKSEEAVTRAVRGMLPKGPLGRQMMRKLKVYPGAEHPHGAQNPQPLSL
ncbi:MAG TPA: 50S ribosomal protein L13 [Myxococcales bacterium]|nr:50S ribosomal protein L13 [Myxococcales bacterium]HAN30331.1 50S ribosomal protein L13 [Myxococcales bacterium]